MEQVYKRRRSIFAAILAALLVLIGISPGFLVDRQPLDDEPVVLSESVEGSELASVILEELVVKGRAPKTGYARDEFGSGWASIDGCDTRNIVLQDSLMDVKLFDDGCVVQSGQLLDPYTGQQIDFVRGTTTSDKVQVDHVIALSDAWQKGAQQLDFSERVVFANDPLNLLAVDGSANQQKGDSDAASWLPSNKSFRCRYIARQIAVKAKYDLWVTPAEKAAMKRVLNSCKEQKLPVET